MSPQTVPAHPNLSPGQRRWADAGATLLITVVVCLAIALMGPGFRRFFLEHRGSLEGLLSRLSALLAVNFIFLEMMTGSFRPLLRRAFEGAAMQAAHVTFGLLGLGFALAHFGLLIPNLGSHWAQDDRVFFLVGPIVLGLLIITIITALYRNRLRISWRWLHLLNYLIFAGAIFHGLVIGREGNLLATRIVFSIYLAIALVGLAYRASFADWRTRFRRAAH